MLSSLLNLFRKSGEDTGYHAPDGDEAVRWFAGLGCSYEIARQSYACVRALESIARFCGAPIPRELAFSQGAAGIDPNPYGSSGAGGNALNLHTHSDRTEG